LPLIPPAASPAQGAASVVVLGAPPASPAQGAATVVAPGLHPPSPAQGAASVDVLSPLVGGTVLVPAAGFTAEVGPVARASAPTAQVGDVDMDDSTTPARPPRLDSSAARGSHHSPASAAIFNTSSMSDSGYAASFLSVDEDNSGYRSQRWEIKRARACGNAPLPNPMSLPVSGFNPISTTSGKKRLPPGVRRTRAFTYVTTHDGKTAQYSRRRRRFADWAQGEDGNACNVDDTMVYPRDEDFASSVDVSEYSLDMISCTSDFSFTAHPADYEEYGGISESQSFYDRFQTYEGELRDVFRMDYSNTPTSLSEVQFRDLRDALFSLAGQVDSNIGHTEEAYRRIRLTDDRLTRTRDALCRHSDITLQWITEVQSLSTDLQEHRRSAITHSQVGEMIQAALVAQRAELMESFSGMLTSALSLHPSGDAPPGGQPRESFTAAMSSLERSIKKRISDHATRVTDDLHRRFAHPPTPVHPTEALGPRPVTWSVASASQMMWTQ